MLFDFQSLCLVSYHLCSEIPLPWAQNEKNKNMSCPHPPHSSHSEVNETWPVKLSEGGSAVIAAVYSGSARHPSWKSVHSLRPFSLYSFLLPSELS